MRRLFITRKRLIIETVAVITITVVLFIICKKSAFEQRGYEAIGGEYAILLLPLFWISFKNTLKDIFLSTID